MLKQILRILKSKGILLVAFIMILTYGTIGLYQLQGDSIITIANASKIVHKEDTLEKQQRKTENTEINKIPDEKQSLSDIESEISIYSTFESITEKEIIDLIDNNKIKAAAKETGDTNKVYIITEDNKKYIIDTTSTDIINYLILNGFEVPNVKMTKSSNQNGGNKTTTDSEMWSSFLFIAMLIVAGGYISYRRSISRQIVTYSSNNSSQNSSDESKTKVKTVDGVEIPVVKFSDVEGVEELKEDVFRIVDCLKNPDKYEKAGARTPKGIILYGPPGTGKTLLAKAIAGEAGVPFIAAVGSDFVEKYVGVGAKRVRELYGKAKKQAPCIVFIDEVDAVAGKREEENSENAQTINALLSELDGFKSTSNIVTICATNRLDMLDSAFTRAGRFDLKLAVGLPDKNSRLKILEIHSRNKKLNEEVDLAAIANKTAEFSGAELEALMNEAAMLAAGHDRLLITNKDIDDAFFKIIMQGNKKKREIVNEENRLIAWHESGHTLATKLLTDDSVNSVTIIGSSSGAGGVTFRTPKNEGLQSKKYLRNLIAVMYAGRAAEEIYLGNNELITTGASQDIKQATSIIKQYLGMYGMGELGMLDITQLNRDFDNIVSEATKLSTEIYKKTLQILRSNKEILKDLAESLLDKETLDEKEIDKIIKRHTKRMVEDFI